MQYCNPHYAREHSHKDIMRCYVAHYIIFAILEVDHNIVSVNAIPGLSFVIWLNIGYLCKSSYRDNMRRLFGNAVIRFRKVITKSIENTDVTSSVFSNPITVMIIWMVETNCNPYTIAMKSILLFCYAIPETGNPLSFEKAYKHEIRTTVPSKSDMRTLY